RLVGLLLDRAGAIGGMHAVVALAVTVVAILPVGTVMAVYAVDPLLILHFDPTLLERASLLSGELIVCGRVPDKHGNMAAGYAENSGLPGATAADASWRSRPPGEDRSRPAPNRAGRRRRRRGGRRWPTSAASGSRAP